MPTEGNKQVAYPPAPWALQGQVVQTLHLVDVERVRPFVPPDLQIVSVLPGRTLGVVYFASYGPGSMLEYNELIIAPALTRFKGKLGFWISHIYVDNVASMAGGREIWGLPKELAHFTWEREQHNGKVVVRQGERLLCALNYNRVRSLWRQLLIFPALSILGSDVLQFSGRMIAGLGISKGHLEVPEESPFAEIGFASRKAIFHCRKMKFIARAPTVVSQLREPKKAHLLARDAGH